MGPTCACAHHRGRSTDEYQRWRRRAQRDACARYANPLLRLLFRNPYAWSLGPPIGAAALHGRRSAADLLLPGRRAVGPRPAHHHLAGAGGMRTSTAGHRLRRVPARRGMARRAGGRVPGIGRDRDLFSELIESFGQQRAGDRPGLRVNVDRAPTHEELVDAVTPHQALDHPHGPRRALRTIWNDIERTSTASSGSHAATIPRCRPQRWLPCLWIARGRAFNPPFGGQAISPSRGQAIHRLVAEPSTAKVSSPWRCDSCRRAPPRPCRFPTSGTSPRGRRVIQLSSSRGRVEPSAMMGPTADRT